MTANLDATRSAAPAATMLDRHDYGQAYTAEKISVSREFSNALAVVGLPIISRKQGFTASYEFAVIAAPYGGEKLNQKFSCKVDFWPVVSG